MEYLIAFFMILGKVALFGLFLTVLYVIMVYVIEFYQKINKERRKV